MQTDRFGLDLPILASGQKQGGQWDCVRCRMAGEQQDHGGQASVKLTLCPLPHRIRSRSSTSGR